MDNHKEGTVNPFKTNKQEKLSLRQPAPAPGLRGPHRVYLSSVQRNTPYRGVGVPSTHEVLTVTSSSQLPGPGVAPYQE